MTFLLSSLFFMFIQVSSRLFTDQIIDTMKGERELSKQKKEIFLKKYEQGIIQGDMYIPYIEIDSMVTGI